MGTWLKKNPIRGGGGVGTLFQICPRKCDFTKKPDPGNPVFRGSTFTKADSKIFPTPPPAKIGTRDWEHAFFTGARTGKIGMGRRLELRPCNPGFCRSPGHEEMA